MNYVCIVCFFKVRKTMRKLKQLDEDMADTMRIEKIEKLTADLAIVKVCIITFSPCQSVRQIHISQ